ncbi:MAG: putative DNA binding domain-containing protein [Cyclobacteriaceae bacterium]
MTAEELQTLISSGEGYQAEWKRSVPSKVKELTEEICAFANAAGGTLLVGVDDHNQIIGAAVTNAKLSAIQNSINEINPPVQISMETVALDGKEVLCIEVPSGKQKPYVFSGAIYVRQGPNTQNLTTAEQMRDFFQQSDRIFFDELPVPEFDSQRDLDQDIFELFRKAARFSPAVSNEQIIRNLRLTDTDGLFKMGSVLFFGKSPISLWRKRLFDV